MKGKTGDGEKRRRDVCFGIEMIEMMCEGDAVLRLMYEPLMYDCRNRSGIVMEG